MPCSAKKQKLPKERNFSAAAIRDPNGPFRPKTIPDKHEVKTGRKRKHKGQSSSDT
jgi:hypothetical protein